ncbi:hypothetical protein H6G91_39345 [Nostoc muscorum FACHB-395]|nr:hypothetical protein [Desmonostoc muscorum FACHB-395]
MLYTNFYFHVKTAYDILRHFSYYSSIFLTFIFLFILLIFIISIVFPVFFVPQAFFLLSRLSLYPFPFCHLCF